MLCGWVINLSGVRDVFASIECWVFCVLCSSEGFGDGWEVYGERGLDWVVFSVCQGIFWVLVQLWIGCVCWVEWAFLLSLCCFLWCGLLWCVDLVSCVGVCAILCGVVRVRERDVCIVVMCEYLGCV